MPARAGSDADGVRWRDAGCDAFGGMGDDAGCDADGVGRLLVSMTNSLCGDTLSERLGNGFLLARQGPAMTRTISIPDNQRV
jgi:hypothetical protein